MEGWKVGRMERMKYANDFTRLSLRLPLMDYSNLTAAATKRVANKSTLPLDTGPISSQISTAIQPPGEILTLIARLISERRRGDW